MHAELARKRPANEIEPARIITGHLVATVRPIERPSLARRIMTPADWPLEVVLLLHLAAAGAVVMPVIWILTLAAQG